MLCMETDDNSGLRSIERSNLSSARQASAGRRKRVRRPVADARPKRTNRRRSRVRKLIILAVLVGIAALVLVHTTFANATLTLTVASTEVTVDDTFSAIREPAQLPDGISYRKVGPFSEVRSATITTITRERQNTYAEGTITVYNTNRSGEKLSLVNRTRFVTGDGRIYRLVGRQVIPGGRNVNGEFVPGRKEVRVAADKIGDGYNIETNGTQFSIPGLSKYAQFSSSYALSKTKIVGGFSGERFIPDSDEEKAARERLRQEIEAEVERMLVDALETNTLAQMVVFDAGTFIDYESLENEQGANGVVIREKGTLHAVAFRERELAALLVNAGTLTTPAPRVEPATATVVGLTMEMVEDEEFDVVSSTEFSFRLQGNSEVFWDIDEPLFLSDVEGLNKNEELDKVIAEQYPQINDYDVSLFPTWRGTLPGNREKISVSVRY